MNAEEPRPKSDDDQINDIIRRSALANRFVLMAKTDRSDVTFAKVKTPSGIEPIEAFWDVNSTVDSVAEDLLLQAKAKTGE